MVISKNEKRAKEPELRPDGWERFEEAVDAAVKSGPKHRVPNKESDLETRALALGKDISAMIAELDSRPFLRPRTPD